MQGSRNPTLSRKHHEQFLACHPGLDCLHAVEHFRHPCIALVTRRSLSTVLCDDEAANAEPGHEYGEQ